MFRISAHGVVALSAIASPTPDAPTAQIAVQGG